MRFGPSAEGALETLYELVRRVQADGGLGDRTLQEATWQFHCLCEGLATVDLRGGMSSSSVGSRSIWADALGSLVAGWRVTPAGRPADRRVTSPYFLQHVDNPVDWYPWGRRSLRRSAPS